MAQVRPCRHARPVLQREERNAAPEFVREPRRGLPRPSEPSSLVRPFGSREVCVLAPPLMRSIFSALLLRPDFTSTNCTSTSDRSGSSIRRDSRTMLGWCQDARDGKRCFSLHEGRPGLQLQPGGLFRLLQSRPKPALCEDWSAAETLVRKTSPGRPCRRALTTASRMLNLVAFVKSLDVVLFCCFLLEAKSSHLTRTSSCANSSASRWQLGRYEEDRLGADRSGDLFRWYDQASRPSRDGWPSAGTPRSQVRDIPAPCRSDPSTGPNGIVGYLYEGVKRSIEVLTNCFRWNNQSR
jgi:hypothetical protein